MMRPLLVPALLSMVALLSACQTPPQGTHSGRLSSTTTTPGEANSRNITSTSLVEASDKISQALAADIQRISSEVGGQFRVTVVFGDLDNKTQGVTNTADFEFLRDRIKSKLAQSGMFRENVAFVLNRAKLADLNRREMGAAAPELTPAGQTATSQLNPNYTLYLNGYMYGVFREGTNLYYLKFELDRASNGETVFSNDYEVKRG